MSLTVTVELEEEVLQALDRLSQSMQRPRGELVTQAVRDYLDVQAWQLAKIEAGIAAADNNEFATNEHWKRNSGNPSCLPWCPKVAG